MRKAALLAASLIVLAGSLPAYAFSPTVIDEHESSVPPIAVELSESTGGTVYASDRQGNVILHNYFLPAESSTSVDLGPRAIGGPPATIVGNEIAQPLYSDSLHRVTGVRYCAVPCGVTADLSISSTEHYLTNTGSGVLLYTTSNQLRLRYFAGGPDSVYTGFPSALTNADDINAMSAAADANGAVIQALADIYYLPFADDLSASIGSGADVAISPSDIAWYSNFDGPSGTVGHINRLNKADVGVDIPTVRTVAEPDPTSIERLAITDTTTAWLMNRGDGRDDLYTAVGTGAGALYPRPLQIGSVTMFGTADFLVMDRAAAIPGLYRISPSSPTTGTLIELLGTKYANTINLALSAGRAAFIDDTSAEHPVFVRDIDGASAGPESTIASDSNGYGVGLGGPFVAYLGATPGDVFAGRTGSALRRFSVPTAYAVSVSGHRALVLTEGASRLLDIVTGATSVVPAYSALWGDYLVSLDATDGEILRLNLATGATTTVRAAGGTGCTSACIDTDAWDLTMWGERVVYAFQAAVFRGGVWKGGTTTALPFTSSQFYDFALSDGLLATTKTDISYAIYDLRPAGTQHQVALDAEAPFAIDYNLVAWTPDEGRRAVVETIDHAVPGYTSAPRYLGGVVPTSFSPVCSSGMGDTWTPRFYATHDLTSWTLSVDGVPKAIGSSTNRGELAPVWDGSGAAAGAHTWTLSGTDVDGLALKEPNGTGAAISGTVTVDCIPPATPTVSAPTLSTDVSATASFPVSWSSAGASRYDVTRSVDGGGYTAWLTNTAATSATFPGAAGHTYRFRVLARDSAGNPSAGVGSDSTITPFDDASLTFSTSGWATFPSSIYYLGSLHRSSTAGAGASLMRTTTAWRVVGTKCASCGQLQVSLDHGAYVTVDTHAASTAYRQVLFTKFFSGAAAVHTIQLRVVGTSGRPYVYVDGVATQR